MTTKKHITARIANLDPIKDHQEIAFLLGAHSFYWDTERALEFALFRTYAVPSISKLLAQTGEFRNRPRKRYDDTELILSEILEEGYDSERAKRAFARMNAMHQRFKISNEDFLYVLSTFVFVPMDWLEQFGWRKLTNNERLAVFLYYKEVGKRMNIKNIPDNIEDFKKFHLQYERDNFNYSESNREIANYTVNLLLGFYLPKSLFFLGRPLVPCFMDSLLLQAMGMKPAPKWLQSTIFSFMRLRAAILRRLPERKTPHLLSKVARPTYPEGYKTEELGTFPQIRK